MTSLRSWTHRHPILVNLFLIVAVVAPGYFRVETLIDDQHDIIDQACEDRRDQKIILRQLVELSDDGRGGLNLTRFESFNDLDPAMQKYLRDLEAASRQAPQPSKFVENALALLDVPQCSNE